MENLGIDPTRIQVLLERERETFAAAHPRSRALFERGKSAYLYGTPLHWMGAWAGAFPIFLQEAAGARLRDVDGNDYVDLCLGDTGAMFGHAEPQIVDAICRQAGRGVTAMLPTEDGLWVADELARRFGLPYWQLATSASDANRFVIRLARMVTGRSKVLVFDGNYHGSVDETQVEFDDHGEMVPRANVHPNGMDHRQTTRLVAFNDVDGLERALAQRDVACVLTEPLLTNIGMVPAAPGFHAALRALTQKHGTLLILDETHTISTGPGGATRAFGLHPDIFVLGKAIGGGIPSAVYGVRRRLAERIWQVKPPPWAGGSPKNQHAGFGGTLVGNALTLAAIRATLEHVMTDANYRHMTELATRLAQDVEALIREHRLPWHVTQIGARVEYMFTPRAPLNGAEARAGRHALLESAIHLFLMNRGVLLTPFHNMMLVCPALEMADVERHNEAFRECLNELAG